MPGSLVTVGLCPILCKNTEINVQLENSGMRHARPEQGSRTGSWIKIGLEREISTTKRKASIERVLVLAPLRNSCMTLGKSFHRFQTQLSHLQIREL